MTIDYNPAPVLHGPSHDAGGIDAVFGVVPVGTYLPWDSSKGPLPDGWQVADGTNGTINMKDQMVVGAGNLYANGSTGGGLASVTLSHDHNHTGNHTHPMPTMTHDHNHDSEAAHTHNVFPVAASTNYASAAGTTPALPNGIASSAGTAHTHTAHSDHSLFTTSNQSADPDAHSNHSFTPTLPPYVALTWIVRMR